ncbi:hypothetical protein Tcan_18287 [Toxocara canis]|uniref:Uncharacterized protein n=1 Tax=Toxocara canis TaxID=6265 RepID=A0A0B2VEW1_TOXCA|nr:hypothetical protein Tcan_18287 [Toxocara canis]
MPSVDGWKKRQPNSSSSSSSGPGSSTSRFNYKGADFLRSEFPHHEQSQVTSYGAALARGQLPPAYTLADSAVYSQDPFSSDASSMSTLSSLSEGTPTPPPRTQISTSNERNGSLFPDGSSLDDYFAEQYDRTLQLDEVAYEDGNEGIRSGNPAEHNVRSCPFYTMEPATYADVAATSSAAEDLENTTSSNKVTYEESNEDIRSRKPAAHHLPSRAFYTMEPAAYADVVATSCAVEDLENTPPNKEVMFKRPGTLHLRTALVEDGQNSESELNDRKKRNCHELLRNFNADKFIADMGYYGSNVERVLRDLAALKTPVAPPTVCSADSPHTPAVCSDLPSWARAPERQTNVSDDWWLGDTSGAYIDDIWSRDVSTCSNAKSKLSIWRDAELLTAVPCDNN